MIVGLQKYSGSEVRRRASSPKLQVLNTALITALDQVPFEEARRDRQAWGRLVESAVGAHLANAAAAGRCRVFYWRHRNREVDFVLTAGPRIAAIEVKSGRSKDTHPGKAAFARTFRPHRMLLVGDDGIPLEGFLSRPPESWLGQ